MEFLLKDVNVYQAGTFQKMTVVVEEDHIAGVLPEAPAFSDMAVFQWNDCFLFPGFTDVHVHLREPGFSCKETIGTGTLAAAHGGYTQICAMPNLSPVPDCLAHLALEQELIRRDAVVHVYPYGAITVGERGEKLAQLAELAQHVIAFSDDGKGVQDAQMMRTAMEQAKCLGKMIVAHCEDEPLLRGGYIHDGVYARAHGHRGIASQSEWGQIARDLFLAEQTGCAYHVCHISCKESVELIRQAKRRGVDVTCETAPHYLLLDETMLQEDGRFKMNPPLRGEEDRQALLEGLTDGTIDMIATDHAPHTQQEKSGGLEKSLNGIVGLETAFAVLYTGLVQTGILTLEKLVDLLHTNAARRFKIGTPVKVGQPATFTVFDLKQAYSINPEEFCSMGRSTPFADWRVFGRCMMTVCDGRIVWQERQDV